MSNPTNDGSIGVDENGDPVFPTVPASPQELSSTTKLVTVEPTTSSLTVSVEMAKSTEYAKEKKSVTTYLKVALPDTAITADADGQPVLNPRFTEAVALVGKQLLNVCEVAAATQHGLTVQSDEHGVIRVLDLFPGAKAGPAPTLAPGSFTAPAPVAAPAPAAAPAPVAAPPAPVPAAAPVAPGAPPAPVAGAFPAPAPAVPAAGGGFQKSNNPLAWSNQTAEMQAWIISTIEAWVLGGGVGTEVVNRMLASERYPGVTVNTPAGGVKVSGKSLLKSTAMGANTKAWAQNCVNAGVVLPN